MRYLAFSCFSALLFSFVVPQDAASQAAPQVTPERRAAEQTDLTLLIRELRSSNQTLVVAQKDALRLSTRSRQVSAYPDPKAMLTILPYPVFTARGKQRAQLKIEQRIPYPGKLRLSGEIADLEAQSAVLRISKEENTLLLELKLSYYELYRVQREKALIEEFQARLSAFEDVAVTKYEVGEGSQQAILKAQLERNLWSMRVLTLEQTRIEALESISRLVSRPIDASELLDLPILALPRLTETIESLHARALRHRPESMILDVYGVRAETREELARKQFNPDFALSLTYFDIATSDIPLNADGRNAFAIGFSVSIPLQRDGKHARVEESKIRRQQIEEETLELEIAIRSDINSMVGRMNEDLRQLDLIEQVLLPQGEATLNASLSAYTTGQTDFLNLLDSERTLFELRIQSEEIIARYLKTVSSLEWAIGVTSLDVLN